MVVNYIHSIHTLGRIYLSLYTSQHSTHIPQCAICCCATYHAGQRGNGGGGVLYLMWITLYKCSWSSRTEHNTIPLRQMHAAHSQHIYERHSCACICHQFLLSVIILTTFMMFACGNEFTQVVNKIEFADLRAQFDFISLIKAHFCLIVIMSIICVPLYVCWIRTEYHVLRRSLRQLIVRREGVFGR